MFRLQAYGAVYHTYLYMFVLQAYGAAFRYDLVDVVRQSLQNLFARTFAALQAVCASPTAATAARPSDPAVASQVGDNYTEYSSANCMGTCLPHNTGGQPNGGNCDRMPGCGHDAGTLYLWPAIPVFYVVRTMEVVWGRLRVI